MTDKQIIIDGVDVSGCDYYVNNGECANEDVYPDYCKACPNCIYKLELQLKAKEKEREILKKKLDIALRNNTNITHLKLDKVDLQNELDQLKAENEELKKVSCKFKDYCTCDTEKLKQTLTEIKEIAKEFTHGCAFSWECEKCNYSCFGKQILQKISEVVE